MKCACLKYFTFQVTLITIFHVSNITDHTQLLENIRLSSGVRCVETGGWPLSETVPTRHNRRREQGRVRLHRSRRRREPRATIPQPLSRRPRTRRQPQVLVTTTAVSTLTAFLRLSARNAKSCARCIEPHTRARDVLSRHDDRQRINHRQLAVDAVGRTHRHQHPHLGAQQRGPHASDAEAADVALTPTTQPDSRNVRRKTTSSRSPSVLLTDSGPE